MAMLEIECLETETETNESHKVIFDSLMQLILREVDKSTYLTEEYPRYWWKATPSILLKKDEFTSWIKEHQPYQIMGYSHSRDSNVISTYLKFYDIYYQHVDKKHFTTDDQKTWTVPKWATILINMINEKYPTPHTPITKTMLAKIFLSILNA